MTSKRSVCRISAPSRHHKPRIFSGEKVPAASWPSMASKVSTASPSATKSHGSSRMVRSGSADNDSGSKYAGSNNIDEVAWYDDDNSPLTTKPVATKKPNELGIYDMAGNVMEWCSDWYGPYSSEAQIDPVGPETGTDHITRGGCYNFSLPRMCRVSARRYYSPTFAAPANGLRLAL